jgi:hypothetical protein
MSVFLQLISIPMGTNAAVNIANIVLYSYEYDFLIRCLDGGYYVLTESIRYTRRFLDDILALINKDFENYHHLIYPPRMLKLNKESEHLPLHCLDITLYYHTTKHCLATKLHTKADDPKFKLLQFTRYPHPDFFIDTEILYNTFTGECTRLKSHNTFFNTFATNILTIIHYLIDKGYKPNKLYDRLNSFIHANQPFYNSIYPALSLASIWDRVGLN